MPHMMPEIEHTSHWRIETTEGTESVPCDVIGEIPDINDFCQYVNGKLLDDSEPEKVTGYFARLSAPGYLDCTDWSGPYATENEARDYIRDTFDVDPDTGEDLDDE